jgi:hypothetical protein
MMEKGRQPVAKRFLSTIAAPNPIEFDGVEEDGHVDAIQIENPFRTLMQPPAGLLAVQSERYGPSRSLAGRRNCARTPCTIALLDHFPSQEGVA